MCVDVLVITDKGRFYCETVGELAEALGVRQKAVSADPFDFCLCNAYYDKLGARTATEEELGYLGGYTIDRRATAEQHGGSEA